MLIEANALPLSQTTNQFSRLMLGNSFLHSSNEPGEFSQWLCHDDSTINIVLELLLLISNILCLLLVNLHTGDIFILNYAVYVTSPIQSP